MVTILSGVSTKHSLIAKGESTVLTDTIRQEEWGIVNLAQNCLDLKTDERVLLVCEDPKFGWYDDPGHTLLENVFRKLGAEVTKLSVDTPDHPLPAEYLSLVDQNDVIIFAARIGDQGRFEGHHADKKTAMLYARDYATLSSPFAATSNKAMTALKRAVDRVTASADTITITCPLGTKLKCVNTADTMAESGEVTLNRFPLGVPKPVLANKTSGKVALEGWLTPTGSMSYDPPICQFDTVVFAHIKDGMITSFEGKKTCVEAIEKHYDQVSARFGIKKDIVHSWHAGIHPACFFPGQVEDNPDRWANNIFSSPRFLHFHTCGDYPPGEICWMVLDPTIKVDGKALWDRGKLMPLNFDELTDVLSEWTELQTLFDAPEQRIGIPEFKT